MNTDELVPIGEAAKVLNVSVATLRRWEKSGKIAAIRTPAGQRRFLRGEVARVREGRAA